MARLEIRLLGNVEVRLDGEPLRFPTQKTKELFAYLVTHSRCAHPRATLAGLLWAASNEERATVNLRQTLSRLRRMFESVADSEQWLSSSGGAVRFQTGDCWIDVAEFERALTPASPTQTSPPTPPLKREGSSPFPLGKGARGLGLGEGTGVRALKRAIALYRGPFLPGIYEDWALIEAERLQALYLDALEQLADLYQISRAYKQAIQTWQQALQTVPWHERAHRELIRLYALTGDRSAALQQYHEYVETLQQELNATPLPEMQALYERLQQGLPLAPTPERELPSELPFVGRDRELATLKALWQDVLAGRGQTVLSGGEIGVGKTSFVQQFLAQSSLPQPEAGRGVYLLRGACHALGGELPYQPLLQAMRAGIQGISTTTLAQLPAVWRGELAQFVPELLERFPELKPNPEIPLAQAKARWFSAVTGFFAVLTRERPMILFLDDLHWADMATLEYLSYLTAQLKNLRILLIGTYRTEEALEKSLLRAWLDALGPGRSYQPITLPRLSCAETGLLLERWLGVGAQHAVPLLYDEAEGNPLFLRELVRSLARSGALSQDDEGHWQLTASEIGAAQFPESLRELIHASLRCAPERAHGLLGLAAVMGRAFDLAVLQQILRQPEEKLLDSLDKLRKAGIIVEREGRYRFYHEMFRQVVYDELSTERKRLWHRQIGQALEELYPEQLDELAGELTEHFERAQLWEKAIAYAMQAGARAQKIYAYGEARNLFRKALQCFGELAVARPLSLRLKRLKLELLIRYTDRGVFPTVADIIPALEEVQKAVSELIALAQELRAEKELCQGYQRQARVALARGQEQAAREAMLRALELSQNLGDPSLTVEILENMASLHERFGEYGQALEYVRRAVEVPMDDARRRGNTLLHANFIISRLGLLTEAQQTLEQALTLFQQATDFWGQAAVLNNLGDVLRTRGQWPEAQSYYERAHQLASAVQDRRVISTVQVNLGALQSDQGRYDAALSYFERVLALMAEHEGLKGLEIEIFSEQGRAHLGRGELPRALDYSTRAIKLLEEQHGLIHGLTSPAGRIYFTHFQILQANGRAEEARIYLQKAYEGLQKTASGIREEVLRTSFLANVPINRQIMQTFAQHIERPDSVS